MSRQDRLESALGVGRTAARVAGRPPGGRPHQRGGVDARRCFPPSLAPSPASHRLPPAPRRTRTRRPTRPSRAAPAPPPPPSSPADAQAAHVRALDPPLLPAPAALLLGGRDRVGDAGWVGRRTGAGWRRGGRPTLRARRGAHLPPSPSSPGSAVDHSRTQLGFGRRGRPSGGRGLPRAGDGEPLQMGEGVGGAGPRGVAVGAPGWARSLARPGAGRWARRRVRAGPPSGRPAESARAPRRAEGALLDPRRAATRPLDILSAHRA